VSAFRSSVRRKLSDWLDSVLHWDRRMVHAIGENRKLNKFDRMFVTATFVPSIVVMWGSGSL